MTLNRRSFLKQAGFGSLGLGLLSFTPGCTTISRSASAALPRSTPEAQGVSSENIQAFIEAIGKSTHELHSFMMLRHGQVIAEGWWAPYGPEYVHTMYSMSKSFTSSAVGFAVAEGRLTVEDKVISFFPDELPAKISDNLAKLKVKHLLTMSVGNEKEPTGVVTQSENWVKTFLAQNLSHEPGTTFLYNSVATYMCSAIVQKLTGQKIIDYLHSRLFGPLGVTKATWEECPRGINTGGWGLSVQTETLARFGQLYLQKGMWQSRQILPAAWVNEATTFKIQQPLPAKPSRPNEQNDWLQGYCYQFWRCQHNGFRGDGAFGQFTIVLPEQDAVIVMTGESSNMQGELDLVWEHLLPAIEKKAIIQNASAYYKLKQTLENLTLPGISSSLQAIDSVGGPLRKYKLSPNSMGLVAAEIQMRGDHWLLTLSDGQTIHALTSSLKAKPVWRRSETTWPAPRIISGGTPKQGTKYKVICFDSFDRDTLTLTVQYYETPHHDTITCKFDGDKISLSFLDSIHQIRNAKDPRPVLEGKLVG